MEIKRKPTLADTFLASPLDANFKQYVEKGFEEGTKTRIREAKRFILSTDAARYLGEMIRDNPRIIADGHDFAIPPFTNMWVELDIRTLFNTVNNNSEADVDSDAKMGFLFNGNTVRAVVGTDQTGVLTTQLLAIEYLRNMDWKGTQERDFSEMLQTSRMGIDHFFWGSAYKQVLNDPESVRVLRANNVVRLPHKPEALPTFNGEVYSKALWQYAGDMRNIIALLIFLNRTSQLQVIREVPHKRGMIKNKAGVLLKHALITININPEPVLKKICAGLGHSIWRRLHDVRGHFCHDKRARETFCDHDWAEVEAGDNLRWMCNKCLGQRWWRNEHKRGFEEKGLVTSEYRVTANTERVTNV